MTSWSRLPARLTTRARCTKRNCRKNLMWPRATSSGLTPTPGLRPVKEALSERKEKGRYERYERAFARVQNGIRSVSTYQHGTHPVEESLLSPARRGSGHARTACQPPDRKG